MPLLVDTSGLYALMDVSSAEHQKVRTYLDVQEDVLLLPMTVVFEADYLVATRLGVRTELRLLEAVAAGEFRLEPVTSADLPRCIELIRQYADSNIGLVDASIVALAERLRIERILTLDQRHFRMFRPRHCAAFELVP